VRRVKPFLWVYFHTRYGKWQSFWRDKTGRRYLVASTKHRSDAIIARNQHLNDIHGSGGLLIGWFMFPSRRKKSTQIPARRPQPIEDIEQPQTPAKPLTNLLFPEDPSDD